jgi:ribonuclease D
MLPNAPRRFFCAGMRPAEYPPVDFLLRTPIRHPDMTTEFDIIETPAQLENLVGHLLRQTRIAIDLEADSMYHFQEKVCLIQSASAQMNAVIDPLRIRDLSTLRPVFANPRIKKIFHGADYDVRSLYRDFKIDIHNLFDTQLACKFLGIKATGLESVLWDHFGIRLDKKYQRKDWSMRPLPTEMLAYAASDVNHLLPLAQLLDEALRRKGRLGWVKEECELLSRVRPASNDHEPLFMHFKGAGRLRPRNLAVLETLLGYRRKVAESKDRPLFKIFSNKSLLQLAVDKPANLNRLIECNLLSRKQINMYGDDLTQVIQQALQIPADQLPTYPRRVAPAMNPAVPLRMKSLKKWRDKKAKALGLEPGVLLNKSILALLATEKPTDIDALTAIAGLREWQKLEFGHDIIEVLRHVR